MFKISLVSILIILIILFIILKYTLFSFRLPILTRQKKFNKNKFNFYCYIISLPKSVQRRNLFFKYFNKSINHEIVYGVNTNIIKNANKFKKHVDKKYFKVALQLKHGTLQTRPNITYFNLGAIGCYMAHVGIYKKALLKYQKAVLKYQTAVQDTQDIEDTKSTKNTIKELQNDVDKNRFVLIFEDNCLVKSDKFYFEVQEAIDDMKGKFDFVWFYTADHIDSKDQPYKNDPKRNKYKRLDWVMGNKCYLVNIETLVNYINTFDLINNQIDMKMEEISKKARLYYKKSDNILIRSTGSSWATRNVSTIQHSPYDKWYSRTNLDETSTSKLARSISTLHLFAIMFGIFTPNDMTFDGFITF